MDLIDCVIESVIDFALLCVSLLHRICGMLSGLAEDIASVRCIHNLFSFVVVGGCFELLGGGGLDPKKLESFIPWAL